MNTELDAIISSGMGMEECINYEALKRNTVRRDLEDAYHIDWRDIQQLYIMGADPAEIQGSRLEAGCYINEPPTWALVIDPQGSKTDTIIRSCGAQLKMLDVRFQKLERVSLSSLAVNLETLRLSPVERLKKIDGLDSCKKLTTLDLSFTAIGPRFDISGLTTLRQLELAGNPGLKGADGLKRLPDLEELDLSGTSVGEELDLSSQKKLKRLRLVDADQLKRVFGLGDNPELEHLDLSCSRVSRIPDDVRNLKKLVHLDLSDMDLDDLPQWLPELQLDFTNCEDGINLRGTTVPGVDMALFNRKITDPEFSEYQIQVRQWFEEQKKELAKPLNELKVIFLGDGGAGKSHILARLLRDGDRVEDFDSYATPGIVIQNKTYEIGDRRVQVHFWDFGGQEILHSMHRMFLTQRTLYVVVVNARDGTQDERARYWLHNIKSFAGGAPVLLVLNQMDQNPNASINENDLRRLYPDLTEVIKISSLHDSKVAFEERLIEVFKRQIMKFETLNTAFLPAWSRLKDRLQNMQQTYIRGTSFRELCDECGVEDNNEIRRALLHWFSDLGVSFCFSGARLEDHIVLSPDWVTNAIYMILFNRLDEVKNGLVSHDAIYRLLGERANDVRRVLSDVTYSVEEVEYILNVMRKFRLSFMVEDSTEFIPMLCARDSLPIAQDYAADPATLELRMHYDYLPNNVLHRLMVDRRRELDRENVWLTGARFVYGDGQMSAVVKSEGDLLRILVRSDGEKAEPQFYLDALKNNLERINAEMGLHTVEQQIAYKAHGQVEYFNYEDLLHMQEMGVYDMYSMRSREKVALADILKQTTNTAERQREKLVQDITSACMQMQSNRLYWQAKEDDRNTFIRDVLRAKGYYVADQTLVGNSASGKWAGSADLDIRRVADIPWTIYEGLDITGTGKSQIAYWDTQLKKLLDNFNPNGLPFLFLVCYVDCAKDRFDSLCANHAEHLRFYSPEDYSLQAFDPVQDSINNRFLKAYWCVYDRGGIPTTVYHIFARMGE